MLKTPIEALQCANCQCSYERDNCAPMYITIGDGGNIEGPYRNFVDGGLRERSRLSTTS